MIKLDLKVLGRKNLLFPDCEASKLLVELDNSDTMEIKLMITVCKMGWDIFICEGVTMQSGNTLPDSVNLREKEIYEGKILLYPDCELSELFTVISHTKTVTPKVLQVIKDLGFEVNILDERGE